MRGYLRRAALLVTSAWLLVACDTVRDQTAVIDYVPASSPAVLPGAQNVTISVVAVDKRSSLRDRLSVKKGIVGAVVTPGNDVIALVRDAVEREFKAQGFVVAPGGLTITVEVQNFYSDFRTNGALFMGCIADVALGLRVKDANGVTLYTHVYDGIGQIGTIFNESAANVKATLEQALANAVSQIVEDKSLQMAMLSGRPRGAGRTGRGA